MGLRVLLVDDNPFDRELARRALGRLPAPPGPVEIVEATDWPAARPELARGGVDLVLLDFHLPVLSGLDVLRELHGGAHPPVVMLTGQDDVATAVEIMRAGAHDYVPKTPAWGAELCRAVERVLERARLERELAASRARLAAYAGELESKVAVRTAVVRAQAAEIEELYLKAEEAGRLKAEIVANVSHELRTPLNVILGYTEMLGETLGPSAAGEMLAKVRSQAERLHRLVESLLALARLNTGTETIGIFRFTLAGLVAELREHAALLNADRGLAIEWRVPPEPHEVEHDQEKIRAIAYHLVSNAIKFTPEGRVEVTAAPTPEGGLVLAVSDTGIGLPPAARTVVFEEFRQLDGSSTRRYEGLGLGLGIVRRYVDLLGGRIEVESAPGAGTRFTVTLPPPARFNGAAG